MSSRLRSLYLPPSLHDRVQNLFECPAPLGAVKIFVVDRVSLALLYLKVHKYWAFFLKDASNFGLENLGVTELISNARLAPNSRNQYPHWPLAYWINFQGS